MAIDNLSGDKTRAAKAIRIDRPYSAVARPIAYLFRRSPLSVCSSRAGGHRRISNGNQLLHPVGQHFYRAHRQLDVNQTIGLIITRKISRTMASCGQ